MQQQGKLVRQQDRLSGPCYHLLDDDAIKDSALLEFFDTDVSTDRGAASWLPIADAPRDWVLSGNMTMLIRRGDLVCIKSLFEDEEIEEGDVCMPASAARTLFIQMERAKIELPDSIDIIWHEDGSATFEWQPTWTRQVLLQKEGDTYAIIDKNSASCQDDLMVRFLNVVLECIRNVVEDTFSWLTNPSTELLDLDTFIIINKLVDWSGNLIIQDRLNADNSVTIELNFFRLISEHALIIANQQPLQIFLKWYEHGVAFEWDRSTEKICENGEPLYFSRSLDKKMMEDLIALTERKIKEAAAK